MGIIKETEIWTSFMNKLDYIKPDLSPGPHPALKNLQDPRGVFLLFSFSFCDVQPKVTDAF